MIWIRAKGPWRWEQEWGWQVRGKDTIEKHNKVTRGECENRLETQHRKPAF